ncbi:hypothetical protein EDD16DRAFT_1713589 [Pisolithus croceorrhizus]|nr:hypothetical protein EDD16DRAFT_1713589 [Pisolithus croceorrhizus]KAI6166749.1 hypothetical protein EDD17DRAFT_1752930 [Pisolithus thermaeus]
MESVVCCDIHNPPEFASYDAPNPKAPRAAQHSHLPKYTKDKSNLDLENALLDWHKEKTATVYGWACLFDNGPVVMTDLMLNHIVDCAHHQKIQTPQDLKRETMWANSNLYASKVLSLIERHATLCKSLYISTPLRQSLGSALTPSISGLELWLHTFGPAIFIIFGCSLIAILIGMCIILPNRLAGLCLW